MIKRQQLALLAAVLGILAFRPGAAAAQIAQGLLGAGAEAEAHAGAGVLAARGAAALYYNPANLTQGPTGLESYFDLDETSLEYRYTFPGYSPVVVDRAGPVPLTGFTYRLPSGLALSFHGSVVPGKYLSLDLDGVPTRALGPTTLVDVHAEGVGNQYAGAAGLAYRLGLLSLGAAVIAARTSVETMVQTADGMSLDSTTSTTAVAPLFGLRMLALGGRLDAGASFQPPSKDTVHASTTVETGSGSGSASEVVASPQPARCSLGLSPRLGFGLQPFVTWSYDAWSWVRSPEVTGLTGPAAADVRSATTLAGGADWHTGGQTWTLAASETSSYLGDGVDAQSAGAGRATAGMDLQNVDAVPLRTYAAGWALATDTGRLQLAVSYATGSRDVPATAAGYGDYAVSLLRVGAGLTTDL